MDVSQVIWSQSRSASMIPLGATIATLLLVVAIMAEVGFIYATASDPGTSDAVQMMPVGGE